MTAPAVSTRERLLVYKARLANAESPATIDSVRCFLLDCGVFPQEALAVVRSERSRIEDAIAFNASTSAVGFAIIRNIPATSAFARKRLDACAQQPDAWRLFVEMYDTE